MKDRFQFGIGDPKIIC